MQLLNGSIDFLRRSLALGALGMSCVLAASAVHAKSRQAVDIQILHVSDLRGQLDPMAVNTSIVAGAPVLKTYFDQHRAANPNTLVLTGGNAVGGTPPLSSFFQDEPTIRAMRLMGFDASGLGNHNFDFGLARLQSQINLAADVTGAVAGRPFGFLSANLRNGNVALAGTDSMKIFNVGGVKVAVIGVTNANAASLVPAGSLGPIVVTDPAVAANRMRAVARTAGAQVVIALVSAGITGLDAGGQATGPLVSFAQSVTGFDLILGGQTDLQYSATINGALVVENRSRGLTYALTRMTVEPGGVASKAVEFRTALAGAVTPDADVTAMLQTYRAQLAPLLATQIASATAPIPRSDACGRSDGRLCESLVGNVTTDALRIRYGADFALTNAGGLRASLTCPGTGGSSGFCPDPSPMYTITRGQVLSVLPFGNVAVTVVLNGSELKAALENGISQMPLAVGRFPQVSGLCLTYDIAAPVGSRVMGVVRQAADGTCTGGPVDLTSASSHRVVLNDFIAAGGDGYPNVYGRSESREILDQVVADYVAAVSPLSPTIQGRIVCIDGNGLATLPNCPVVTAP